MSAILKFDFQKRKQLRSKFSKLLPLTCGNYFLPLNVCMSKHKFLKFRIKKEEEEEEEEKTTREL